MLLHWVRLLGQNLGFSEMVCIWNSAAEPDRRAGMGANLFEVRVGRHFGGYLGCRLRVSGRWKHLPLNRDLLKCVLPVYENSVQYDSAKACLLACSEHRR